MREASAGRLFPAKPLNGKRMRFPSPHGRYPGRNTTAVGRRRQRERRGLLTPVDAAAALPQGGSGQRCHKVVAEESLLSWSQPTQRCHIVVAGEEDFKKST
ncbi:hypothetical protein AAVH_10255 [Aphelenchoides avenae]|nr:hypothetical protein AAVH_10255 [Aphelenchus avenae]